LKKLNGDPKFYFRKLVSLLFLIGGLPDELGGSYFLQTEYGKKEGTCPNVDLAKRKRFRTFL
jgi:phosphoribosylformylglycinamidine (FGAM) synthase-like enzyme